MEPELPPVLNVTVVGAEAGALPAALEQLEERTVGPSLGADSIEADWRRFIATEDRKLQLEKKGHLSYEFTNKKPETKKRIL